MPDFEWSVVSAKFSAPAAQLLKVRIVRAGHHWAGPGWAVSGCYQFCETLR